MVFLSFRCLYRFEQVVKNELPAYYLIVKRVPAERSDDLEQA